MRALLIAVLAVAAGPAFASCYGTGAYQSCTNTDGTSGFSSGGTTVMNGYDARSGTSWSGTASTYGNTTAYQGMSSDGTTWSGQSNNYGYGYSSHSGFSSDGSYYSGYTYGN